jgi:DNA repair protein RecN (Recombination protein N)
MLTQIIIRNFAIAEKIDQRFNAGTTVITGETGAGKSIILDALSLALGDRADSDLVRQGEKRAEIAATFDVSRLPEAREWLQEQDLDQGSDCILRRIITSEGRSRGYINGQPCSIQHLKIIGEMLIDIHGQHEHQSLLKKENHIKLIDNFGQLTALADETAFLFRKMNQQKQTLSKVLSDSKSANAKRELLTYQFEELNQLGLAEGELDQLEEEQTRLSQAGSILQHCQQALSFCDEDDININSMLEQCNQMVNQISINSPNLNDAKNLLSDALIQIQEAASSLRHFSEEIDLNPERLNEVEERLSAIYQLARKHKTTPEFLIEYHQELRTELENMDAASDHVEKLQEEIRQCTETFFGQSTTFKPKKGQLCDGAR